MKKKNFIKEFEDACQLLATGFIVKYFGKDITDWFWVSDQVGNILVIGDYFFNMSELEKNKMFSFL